jgi:hypothetical protein
MTILPNKNDSDNGLPDFLNAQDLEALELTHDDLRRCPGTTELVGLDAQPCWSRTDALAAFEWKQKGGRP